MRSLRRSKEGVGADGVRYRKKSHLKALGQGYTGVLVHRRDPCCSASDFDFVLVSMSQRCNTSLICCQILPTLILRRSRGERDAGRPV